MSHECCETFCETFDEAFDEYLMQRFVLKEKCPTRSAVLRNAVQCRYTT